MRQLLLKTDIHKFDTFADFAKEFEIGEGDLLFTNEFLYTPTMKPLDLKCDVYFQEKYGTTEPTDEMYNAIFKDLKDKEYKRTHRCRRRYGCRYGKNGWLAKDRMIL